MLCVSLLNNTNRTQVSALCYLVKYKKTASRPTTSPPVPSMRGGEARSQGEAICEGSRKPFGIASLYSCRLPTIKRKYVLGRSCLPPLRGEVGRTTVSRSGNTQFSLSAKLNRNATLPREV